ncbi:MAG: C39 family peptidase [Synergistaceae bacterium]|jgi:hypothetical protein|nr:C39 family peptidase [Synergistaceae bacterium]
MKHIFSAFLMVLFICGVASGSGIAPNKIPYPENYDTKTSGASAVEGIGDHDKSPYFAHPDIYNMKSAGSLVVLEKFKTYQQTTEWSCGNASALMVLRHFGDEGHRELDSVKIMGTQATPDNGVKQEGVIYGTTTEGMVKFFKTLGYDVKSSLDRNVSDDMTLSETEFKDWVVRNLKKNTPIMVEWLDWTAHWQVIIGYDDMGTNAIEDDVLILADPYDVGDHLQDGYYIFPARRFFYMWSDIRYEAGSNLASQQWVIAAPPGKR